MTTNNPTTDYWTAIAVATTAGLDTAAAPAAAAQFFEPACDVVIQIRPDKTQPKHIPGFKLTEEQRTKKHDLHKFGLCCSCDAGLDDRADFVCDPRSPGGFALMCNDCFEYYNKNGYVSCGYGPFSNAAYR